jgi:hypothetical protein
LDDEIREDSQGSEFNGLVVVTDKEFEVIPNRFKIREEFKAGLEAFGWDEHRMWDIMGIVIDSPYERYFIRIPLNREIGTVEDKFTGEFRHIRVRGSYINTGREGFEFRV